MMTTYKEGFETFKTLTFILKMKMFPHVDCDYKIISNGELKWSIQLEGSEEGIEATFNHFYNFKATNGKLEFDNNSKTRASFWSSKDQMYDFFFKTHYFKFSSPIYATNHACKMIKEVQENTGQKNFHVNINAETYVIGAAGVSNGENHYESKYRQSQLVCSVL